MIKLSKRLTKVAEFVDEKRVADIGCDHGKLVEYLFQNNDIDYAFVSDISGPSVEKAKTLLSENNRDFDWAVADGLTSVEEKHNIKQAIISGMGGLEIINILKNNKPNICKFVLQPQNNEQKLKKFLIKNKFCIKNDIIVKDKNIFYNVLKVEKKKRKTRVSSFYLRFGKDNFDGNKDFLLYLNYLKDKLEKIYISVPRNTKFKIKIKIKQVNKALKIWEKRNGEDITISKD